MRRVILFAMGVVPLMVSLAALAQPANDNFSNRILLSGSQISVTSSTTGGSREPGEPAPNINMGSSVWYEWVAPSASSATMGFTGSFRPVIGVYTGNAVNALTPVAVATAGNGVTTTSLNFTPGAGVSYKLLVSSRQAQSGTFTMTLTQAVSVSITAPANNTAVVAGSSVVINAIASVPGGNVTRVDFYRNGSLIGADTSAPYSFSDSPPLGTNAYSVVGVSDSANYPSAPVNVIVLNPGVYLTSPADGTLFLDTTPISVTALGLVSSGLMTNVSFLVDGVPFAQDSSAPFAVSWNSVTPGGHLLTAIGRDDAGNSYTSRPIGIGVARTLVPLGSVWKFLDTGTDLGVAWREPGFDDGAWLSGPAELGYGDGDEATLVGSGPDPNNRYITTYFRRAFNVTGAAGYTNVVMRVKRDDGAVVYFNGPEAARYNMPAGPVTFSTLANQADDDGANFFPTNVAASFLAEGNNVLAVEIHQSGGTSSDISFNLELLGIPVIPRNLPPEIALTSPTNNSSFLVPASIAVTAVAADLDGTVTNVSFRLRAIDNTETILGNNTTAPYEVEWIAPAEGWYQVYAVATDNEGVTASSTPSFVTIYDALGTPRTQIFAPTNTASFGGPTNLSIVARATSPGGITNVEYRANGALIGQAPQPSPISPLNSVFIWTNATFGTSVLTTVSEDATGQRGTSAPVTIVVIAPPPNLESPTIAAVVPPPGSTVATLTNLQVTFSERVTGVTAGDLLVNGVPATSVTGGTSSYIFTFPRPADGTVTITWANDAGIFDVGYPPRGFDGSDPGAVWSYTLIDAVPPTVVDRNPPGGAVVTNLSQITVTFSEPVQGVDAADFLVNGVSAIGLSGGGSSYTFSFAQPAAGAVGVSWAAAHGITDAASPPNPFNATGAGATWSYTLDNRTILVQSNANWQFIKGLAEASSPVDAWRGLAFNDSSWSNAPAPFYYGDPYNSPTAPGTLLSDMQGGYSGIYLRRTFTVPSAAAVSNLFLVHQSDDGFIAWINGVEVFRYNMNPGDVPYNGSAPTAITEAPGGGAPYIQVTLADTSGYLVNGVNVLAVHAFNNSPATSSDFGFNAQLYTYVADPSVVPPILSGVFPNAGELFYLTNITVSFSEPVTGVDASDLLINGQPATSLSTTTNTTYSFSFPQPAFGPVTVTWTSGHGIQDLDAPPKPFNATAPGATFSYTLINPSAPTVASQTPRAGGAVTNLTQLIVNFSEPVAGVDASDLRVNGLPATGVTGGPVNYIFTFPQPAYGAVAIGWALNSAIRDLDAPANDFDPARAVNSWSYTLVDLIPPVVLVRNPPAGALVTNLTELSVTFSEPVNGVNTGDLLINGAPAVGVTGAGAGPYVFTFAKPNATVVNVSWIPSHGISDQAVVPNAFNSTGPGATWSYSTPDTVAPEVAMAEPAPFITVRSLTQIRVTFTEPVTGVTTNSLLVNGVSSRQLSGSGAGPYTFTYLPPPVGPVEVRWNPGQLIVDLASPTPNVFAGGEWTYLYDPGASFAGQVLINEIMYDSRNGAKSNEWIELRNVSADLINLTGWRFSRGAGFTFPNVSIPAGGYLVVAADLAAFRQNFPGVTNVVGGWTGSLANTDETIELTTALGETVNSVHYASEGDWAQRERGNGTKRVTSITRNGGTATITSFEHGLTANDQVVISGADQPEYNGRFTVNGVTPSTFSITVPGTPASPATGNYVCRWALDDGFSGWSWFSAAGGFGSSLELINSTLPNDVGQNWLSSLNSGGTPGRANSVGTNNVAPLIQEVTHFPLVPRSTDPVAVTARLRDEISGGVASALLFYRTHTTASPGAFSSASMFDDGAHSDGLAGDGLYGAVLPAAADGTVIEFYVQVSDTGGRTRTWPAPAMDTNGPNATFGTPGPFANALYQVDNETITNTMPVVRFILTGTERALYPPSNRNSDASFNGTIITADGDGLKLRYLCDGRIRGAGSRSRTPPNNRINIPNDNRWNKLDAFNLNSQFVHAQLVGNNLSMKSGLPAEAARVVQYRINGSNPAPIAAPANGSGNGAGWGVFLLVEAANGDLASDLYPQNSGGNFYRASTGNHNADLNYAGTDPTSYLSRGYYKTSNKTENDWTDFINLTLALSQTPNEADYLQAVAANLNVKEWMTYFAVGSLMNYGETALFNGIGDDYALYSGLDDKRFVVLGHDFDTVFGWGDTTASYYPFNTNSSLFIMLNPPNPNGTPGSLQNVLRRFMTNASFAPIFYGEVKRLCDTTFNPTNLNPLFDQLLGTWGGVGPDANVIAGMKTWAANRRSVALSQIPLALTVNHSLTTSSGYLFTSSPAVALSGVSHAIDTRRVLVNGLPANWSAFGASWTMNAALQPGLNRVLVQSLNSDNVEFARTIVEIWYDDGSAQNVSGAMATDTTWTAANGPYNVTGSITINNGVTLTIQPGTTIYLGSGVNITVANGGRLLAEGTETAPIRFSRTPGTTASWGGLTVNGGAGSPETRIAHAHFEFNASTAIHSSGGTVFLDHLTFGNPAVQYVSLDGSSFVVQDCVFPAINGSFEPVHGTAGIKAGGRGIVRRNFWGRVSGYNDAFDFTGGNRPGPILQVINNVFAGSDDDLLDLDSTDAWIEGNIFLHCHRNGSPDSSSAVSGGSDNAGNSQITIVGNIFYDVDQAANAKQTNFYTMINNTIVRQSHAGSQDTNAAVVILADEGTSQGAGLYLEGNIIYDAENLTRNVTTALVTYTNNRIHLLQGAPWSGAGGNNSTGDPLFNYVPQLAETTNFTDWSSAQVLWNWFSLRSGSPAAGAGPGGRDQGAVVPRGVAINGEPVGVTPLNSATLRVGFNRTGSGIPANGFPNGSGFTHFKWRLDGGPWSAETPISTPVALNNLSSGPHYVEAVGRNDAGFFQDDPVFGPDAVISISRPWTVNPGASPLRLNEILASNTTVSNHFGSTPDLVELWNPGSDPIDLGGFGLTDDQANPFKFIFPLNTTLAPGAYLTVFANNADTTPGFHLGFALSQTGDRLYLFNASAEGGALIDSVVFGPQLNNFSIGRLTDGSWALTQPTFGGPNRAASTGDQRNLRINEWLAIALAPIGTDFIELYNADALPVAVGGLFITDEPLGWPDRHQILALSFIGGNGYLRFFADSDAGAGADHLNFSLAGEQGSIALSLPDLTTIDCVVYQPQFPNVSQGRSPNGSSSLVFFPTPTPGAPNPLITGPPPNGGVLVINEVLTLNTTLTEANGRTPDWIEIYNGSASTVDLGERSLTDDTLAPRKYVFPANTLLGPGAYLRVICDPGDPAPGPLVSTNFALSGTGGSVYLFDALSVGGSLLNSITYGLQIPNLTIGRVPDGSTNWVLTSPTPGLANAAVPTFGNPASLWVNEWMANPLPGKDDWFEIYNPGLQPIALGGLYLSDDLNNRTKHRIAELSFVGSGTNGFLQFHADGNTGAGADHVSFSLSAAREAVAISSTNGALLNGISFTNQVEGVSEGRFPDGAAAIVAFPGTDSPGVSNYRLLTTVTINEALTRTTAPLEDAIELRNLTGTPIDLSGWWLSDDNSSLQKYQLPLGTLLPANGFTVIYETHFTNRNEAAIPFALSSHGDEIVLSAATNGVLTGFRRGVKFGAAESGVSFGRYVTSDGVEEFMAMSALTFGVDDPATVGDFRLGTGKTNVYPKVGPVVISEIMYHPPDVGASDNVLDEYIKLRNITTVPVPLFDPAAPTNTWRLRDAVDFDFPTGITLPAGGFLLVVGFDPVNNPGALAAFRSNYSLDAGQPIVGPWSGKLANDNEDIKLRKPGAVDVDGVDSILVEHVRYSDLAPWPPLADGTGYSLQRVSDSGFGNDPMNWVAATPAPGPQQSGQDSDGDGLPDSWETLYNLDPFNPNDASLDSDGDGLTNLDEFGLGTDPRNALSGVSIDSIAVAGASVKLTFTAAANRSYTIERAETLGGGWQTVQTLAAVPTNRVVEVILQANGAKGFYRLSLVPMSALRINSVETAVAGQMTLTFTAPANMSCAVQFQATLGTGSWNTLTNIPAASTDRVIQFMTPNSGAHGFYRLQSP